MQIFSRILTKLYQKFTILKQVRITLFRLLFSTISVTTSFFASYLVFLRSPYYALAYSANDIVLIILWVLASIEDSSYIPMIFCFVMFLFNDIYGYINWQKMKLKQKD